jgi:MoaA/NifB/PqqE/SkfB family radical SAM enzyme
MNKIDSIGNGMVIDWVITNNCNYKCNYCSPNLHSNTSGWPNYDNALKFFNYLHSYNSNKKLIILCGGEPTLWPRLIDFIKESPDGYLLEIVTNGSRTLRWWEKFIDECKDKIHQIAISVHWESADINHLVEVCKLLDSKDMQTTVMIIADKAAGFKKIKTTFKLLTADSLKINVIIKPVKVYTQSGKTQDYSKKEIEWINNTKYINSKTVDHPDIPSDMIVDGRRYAKSYAREILSKNKHNFKGWKCWAGSTRLNINYDGTINGATCRTANSISYGNINDDIIAIDPEPLICRENYCTCLLDIRIPKERV